MKVDRKKEGNETANRKTKEKNKEGGKNPESGAKELRNGLGKCVGRKAEEEMRLFRDRR